MRKLFKVLALSLLAAFPAAAPCLAALGASSVCPMAVCGQASLATSDAVACCCAESRVPAEPGVRPVLLGSAAVVPAGAVSIGALSAVDAACGTLPGVDRPARLLPLYLLNATFLI